MSPPPPPPPSPAMDYSMHYDWCLTCLVLTGVRCNLFAGLLFCGIFILWRCAAAPTAGRVQRCARWLLARLCADHLTRSRVAAYVLVISRLWSRDWSGAAAQVVCAALVLALRSCFSWSERAAGRLIRSLVVAQWAVVAHALTAPTTERLGALELQLFWEIVELVGLDLLLGLARTRLLCWLARHLELYPRRLELHPRLLDLAPVEVD